MWQGLDANKDGLLTKVEVAEMFGVGHLLLQLPADEQQALLAQEFGPQGADAALDPKGLHNMDMQQVTARQYHHHHHHHLHHTFSPSLCSSRSVCWSSTRPSSRRSRAAC